MSVCFTLDMTQITIYLNIIDRETESKLNKNYFLQQILN